MIRTFIAVDLPEQFRENIKRIQENFKDFGITLANPELVHITMKFLGDISEDQVTPIGNALEQVQCKPFEAELKNVGVFPNLNYIRVIWIGAEGNFKELYQDIESVLAPFKFGKPNEKFTAHATLARVKRISKNNRELLVNKIKSLSDIKIGTMCVDTIKLKKSTLTPKGPIYETLKEVKLGIRS